MTSLVDAKHDRGRSRCRLGFATVLVLDSPTSLFPCVLGPATGSADTCLHALRDSSLVVGALLGLWQLDTLTLVFDSSCVGVCVCVCVCVAEVGQMVLGIFTFAQTWFHAKNQYRESVNQVLKTHKARVKSRLYSSETPSPLN